MGKKGRPKVKFLLNLIWVLVYVVALITVGSVVNSSAEASAVSLKENGGVLQVVVGVLFTIVSSLISWILFKIDRSQNILFTRMRELDEKLCVLQGEHNVLTRGGRKSCQEGD